MIAIRLMTAGDVPLGMRLKEEAGWNQTEADWRRFLHLEPDGCFVAELDGVPVATTTTCVFGMTAWIAMVLVDASMRSQGIGTALMRHALSNLDRRGVTRVRLDATPLGRPIYEKLGFVAEYSLARFDGIAQPRFPVPEARPLGDADLATLLRLDGSVSATDREKLLRALFTERPDAWRMAVGRQGTGFLFARAGSRAVQIGPCIADTETGPRLLHYAWNRHAGQRVFIDVPLPNVAAVHCVEEQGLTVQRQLLRMSRGELASERLEMLWASSGPEKG